MSIIYKIQNKTNNKIYIGQTTNNLKHRLGQHLSDKKINTDLSNDLKKLGIENFICEVLLNGQFTSDQLDLMEIIYINNYNSLYPNGYNSTTGGKKNFQLTENIKIKISNTLKGRVIDWNDKISLTMKDKWKDKDYREKMVKAHSKPYGKYKKHKKPLRLDLNCNEINLLFSKGESISMIAKKFNVSYYTIKKRIYEKN